MLSFEAFSEPITARLNHLSSGTGDALLAATALCSLTFFPGVMGYSLLLRDVARLTTGAPLHLIGKSILGASRVRQLSYIAGRCCAERAIEALIGRYYAVGTGEGGAPQWPPGLVGSISHDRTGAVAVVGREEQISMLGVDIESIFDVESMRSVVSHCLTPRERHFVASRGPVGATMIFSAKESYYKAIFPKFRRWVDFTAVEITQFDPISGRLQIEPILDSCPGATLPALGGIFRSFDDRVSTCVAQGAA